MPSSGSGGGAGALFPYLLEVRSEGLRVLEKELGLFFSSDLAVSKMFEVLLEDDEDKEKGGVPTGPLANRARTLLEREREAVWRAASGLRENMA